MTPFPLRFAVLSLALTLGGTAHAQSKAPASSSAGPTKEQCIAAAEEGQSLRDGGRLRDARARFVTCAAAACPGVVSKECSAWLTDMEARLPTVIFSAVDGAGNDLVDVKVSVDGQPLLTRLTGTQTPIDPGPHRFRFETPGAAPVEETWVISERQKGRALQAKFAAPLSRVAKTEPPPAAPPEPPKEPARSSPPTAAYVVGGVGVAALASFAVFGILGLKQHSDLNKQCGDSATPKDTCTDSDVSPLKTKLLVADVSLGVGVVAAGVATYLFLSYRSSEKAAASAVVNNPVLRHAVVSPTRGGGWVAGYETRF